MKASIPAPAGALLDFLAKYESRGNYLAYFGHGDSTAPLPATLAAVLQFQDDLVRVKHMASSATGRYQFMPTTLRGLMNEMQLPGTTPFTPDLQDELGYRLLKRRGYDKWISNSLSNEAFADNLSMEWASMPYRNGKSYYDSGLNHSLVSRERFVGAIAGAHSLVGTVASRPVPSAATPIVTQSLKPQAPAGAAPTKEKTMDSSINFGAGFANVFENLAHSIFTGGAAVENPGVDTKTSGGDPITNFGADIEDAKRVGSEILEIVGDFRSKNLAGGVDDAIDLARTVFGALDRHGVKVPIVTEAIKSIDLDKTS